MAGEKRKTTQQHCITICSDHSHSALSYWYPSIFYGCLWATQHHNMTIYIKTNRKSRIINIISVMLPSTLPFWSFLHSVWIQLCIRCSYVKFCKATIKVISISTAHVIMPYEAAISLYGHGGFSVISCQTNTMETIFIRLLLDRHKDQRIQIQTVSITKYINFSACLVRYEAFSSIWSEDISLTKAAFYILDTLSSLQSYSFPEFADIFLWPSNTMKENLLWPHNCFIYDIYFC